MLLIVCEILRVLTSLRSVHLRSGSSGIDKLISPQPIIFQMKLLFNFNW